MTKFEWERQLKKAMSTLPRSEQQRVLDYYNELFADKIELKMHEEDIICEFGNPYDVANRLIVDFYNENGQQRPKDTRARQNRRVDDDFEFDIREEPPLRSTRQRRPSQEDDEFFGTAEIPYRDRSFNQQQPSIPLENSHQNARFGNSQTIKKANSIIWSLATVLFFVFGAFFRAWHPAWMLFLAAIVVGSIVTAVVRKSLVHFNYPVLLVFVFLLLGFSANMWSPTWVLFVTIPFYYAIVGGKKKGQTPQHQEGKTYRIRPRQNPSPVSKPVHEPQGKVSAGSVFGAILLAFVFFILVLVLWTTVLSLFLAGIGMLTGGAVALVFGISQYMAGAAYGLALVGAPLIVFGLGLMFIVGIVCLFNALAKATKGMFGLVGTVANGGVK